MGFLDKLFHIYLVNDWHSFCHRPDLALHISIHIRSHYRWKECDWYQLHAWVSISQKEELSYIPTINGLLWTDHSVHFDIPIRHKKLQDHPLDISLHYNSLHHLHFDCCSWVTLILVRKGTKRWLWQVKGDINICRQI